MNKFLGVFCAFLLSASLWAQDTEHKKINGVLNSSSGEVSGIHIVNVSSHFATISDEYGYFSVTAKINDTLVITGIGYQKKELVVNSVIYNQFSVAIELDSEVIALNEVVIMPYNLSGDLSVDMDDMRAEDQLSEFSLGLPNADVAPMRKSQRILNEATTGGGIVPLNPILNGISGRTKKLKKIVEYDLRNQQTLRARYYYPDSLFVKYLKIDDEKILDFMYYCETDPEFNYYARLKDKFKIWELMLAKSIVYKAQNDLN